MYRYTVSFDGKWSQKWYAHKVGYPNIPVFDSFGTKKYALTVAGNLMGMTYEQYMEWRKKNATRSEVL